MTEPTKASARKLLKEMRKVELPHMKTKVVVFGKTWDSQPEEESIVMLPLSKIYDIALDALNDEELVIYKLKLPYPISPHVTKAALKPLAMYFIPSLSEFRKVNIVASIYVNHKGKNWRKGTIVAFHSPNKEYKLISIVISTSADDFNKDDIIKLMRRERTEAKKYILEALKAFGHPPQPVSVSEVLVARIAKSFNADEIKVRIEDGSEVIDVNLKLREPQWTLNDFPDDLTTNLRTIVTEPLKDGKEYAVKGLIIAGPPGMGKSVLVEAIAHELNKKVVDLEPGMYRSMWYGHTEKIIRKIFENIKHRNDVVVLFDDAEYLMSRNMSMHEGYIAEISTFLKLFQERERPLIALTANYPELIDPALLRPGRVDVLVVLGYPDKNFRRKIVHTTAKKYGIKISEDILEEAVRLTRWFSSAEIDAMIRMAIMKGKGTLTSENLLWARKRFSISESERQRMQERTLWYLQKIQGIIISYVKRPEEV